MHKRLLVLIAVFALTLPFASPAAANPPLRQEFPVPEDGIPLLPELCGFPILLTADQDNAKVITFFNTQGQPRFSLTNGALKLRLTNTNTGRSIVLNAAGPGRFDADFSTLSTQGNWLIFLNNSPVPGAPSRLFYVTGRSVMNLDGNANATTFRLLSGQTENLCPRLS